MICTWAYNYWCWCQPWSQLAPVYPGRQSHSPVTWWQGYDCPQDGHDILHWSPYVPALHSGRQRDKEWATCHTVNLIRVYLHVHWLTTLTVLTGDSPVAWTTHTRPGFPHARVAVGAMLETRLVAVAPPQAFCTRLATAETFRGKKGEWISACWYL